MPRGLSVRVVCRPVPHDGLLLIDRGAFPSVFQEEICL